MGKKVIINENMLKRIIAEGIISESELSKADVANIVKDTIKNDAQVKKDIEKKVKELVAGTVNIIFKKMK